MSSRVVKSPHCFYLILSYFILFILSLIGQSIRSPITHRQPARHVIRRSLVGASASPRSTGNEAGDPVVLEFPEGKEDRRASNHWSRTRTLTPACVSCFASPPWSMVDGPRDSDDYGVGALHYSRPDDRR